MIILQTRQEVFILLSVENLLSPFFFYEESSSLHWGWLFSPFPFLSFSLLIVQGSFQMSLLIGHCVLDSLIHVLVCRVGGGL